MLKQVLSTFFLTHSSVSLESKLNNYIANLDSTTIAAKDPSGPDHLTLGRSNVVAAKSWFSCGRKIHWQNMPDREILNHNPDMEIGPNKISTGKYSVFTFLPKNLIEQFSKLANLYFLVPTLFTTFFLSSTLSSSESCK